MEKGTDTAIRPGFKQGSNKGDFLYYLEEITEPSKP